MSEKFRKPRKPKDSDDPAVDGDSVINVSVSLVGDEEGLKTYSADAVEQKNSKTSNKEAVLEKKGEAAADDKQVQDLKVNSEVISIHQESKEIRSTCRKKAQCLFCSKTQQTKILDDGLKIGCSKCKEETISGTSSHESSQNSQEGQNCDATEAIHSIQGEEQLSVAANQGTFDIMDHSAAVSCFNVETGKANVMRNEMSDKEELIHLKATKNFEKGTDEICQEIGIEMKQHCSSSESKSEEMKQMELEHSMDVDSKEKFHTSGAAASYSSEENCNAFQKDKQPGASTELSSEVIVLEKADDGTLLRESGDSECYDGSKYKTISPLEKKQKVEFGAETNEVSVVGRVEESKDLNKNQVSIEYRVAEGWSAEVKKGARDMNSEEDEGTGKVEGTDRDEGVNKSECTRKCESEVSDGSEVSTESKVFGNGDNSNESEGAEEGKVSNKCEIKENEVLNENSGAAQDKVSNGREVLEIDEVLDKIESSEDGELPNENKVSVGAAVSNEDEVPDNGEIKNESEETEDGEVSEEDDDEEMTAEDIGVLSHDGNDAIIADFSKLEIVQVLRHDGFSVELEAVHTSLPGKIWIKLKKTPFDQKKLREVISGSTNVGRLVNNDVYSVFSAALPEHCNKAVVAVMYPVGEKKLMSIKEDPLCVVEETASQYESVSKWYIRRQSLLKKQWLCNILDGVSEAERVILRDVDPETGFVLLPDFKWNGEQLSDLYCQAIVNRKDLASIRDLTGNCLPLLRNIRDKGSRAICEKYGVHEDQLYVFLHYLPSFYHLYVHFTNLAGCNPDCHYGNIHSLSSVISNLELDPQYYRKCTLSFVVGQNNPHPLCWVARKARLKWMQEFKEKSNSAAKRQALPTSSACDDRKQSFTMMDGQLSISKTWDNSNASGRNAFKTSSELFSVPRGLSSESVHSSLMPSCSKNASNDANVRGNEKRLLGGPVGGRQTDLGPIFCGVSSTSTSSAVGSSEKSSKGFASGTPRKKPIIVRPGRSEPKLSSCSVGTPCLKSHDKLTKIHPNGKNVKTSKTTITSALGETVREGMIGVNKELCFNSPTNRKRKLNPVQTQNSGKYFMPKGPYAEQEIRGIPVQHSMSSPADMSFSCISAVFNDSPEPSETFTKRRRGLIEAPTSNFANLIKSFRSSNDTFSSDDYAGCSSVVRSCSEASGSKPSCSGSCRAAHTSACHDDLNIVGDPPSHSRNVPDEGNKYLEAVMELKKLLDNKRPKKKKNHAKFQGKIRKTNVIHRLEVPGNVRSRIKKVSAKERLLTSSDLRHRLT